jgi:hypothetical protein
MVGSNRFPIWLHGAAVSQPKIVWWMHGNPQGEPNTTTPYYPQEGSISRESETAKAMCRCGACLRHRAKCGLHVEGTRSLKLKDEGRQLVYPYNYKEQWSDFNYNKFDRTK